MIAIESSLGHRIKNLSNTQESYTLHPKFGFVSETQLDDRIARRKRHGLKVLPTSNTVCRFSIEAKDDGFEVLPLSGCRVKQVSPAVWSMSTDSGEFFLKPLETAAPWVSTTEKGVKDDSSLWKYSLLALAFLALTLGPAIYFSPERVVEPEVITQPVQVTVIPEKKIIQKTVSVPASNVLPQITDARIQDKTVKRAIQQNLGFLGMLGRKDLSKAVGGMPTSIKDASPGAGPGGKEGSGGEFLVGLGQGVRKATVGNTGVAGLGGVGTKGVGGGAGGYGNTMIGSGEGRALSNVAAVSNDMVLEGGLDRAVIQATIAKYLGQVRSCYEAALQSNPGLAGQVTMGFVINGAGDVASSRVHSSTLGNATAENCIATKLQSWKFPKPLGGVNVKVNYPFLLRPMGT